MKHKMSLLALFTLMALLISASGTAAHPAGSAANAPTLASTLGTAFTYQGTLTDGASPANGTYDFEFKLFNDATNGTLFGTISEQDITVANGLFDVELDFGTNAYTGGTRYLEIGVRSSDSNDEFTTLAPRRALTATPYAIYASKSPWTGLSDLPSGFADGIDDDTKYTAGTGLELNADQFSLNNSFQLPQTCSYGQVAKWNGTSWMCASDNTGEIPDSIPSGAVMFFNLGVCPAGWEELNDAQGRYLVGMPDSGTLGELTGTALEDGENRAVGQHNHTITDPEHAHGVSDPSHNHNNSLVDPEHNHSVDDPGHNHAFSVYDAGSGMDVATWDDDNSMQRTNYTSDSQTGISINDNSTGIQITIHSSQTGVSINNSKTAITINEAGAVIGTNAPYIQLLVCQKQ